MSFEPLHFQPAFSVAVDPEFPGRGEWDCPVFSFAPDGEMAEAFRSPWGTPFIIEVTPHGGGKWVGAFPNGSGRVYATPAPDLACVVGDDAWLVDVRNPDAGAKHLLSWPTQTRAFKTLPLLLIADQVSIVAVGAGGVAWRSPRLCSDDLRIDGASEREVRCHGSLYGKNGPFAVDAKTGRRLDGVHVEDD